MEFEEEVLRIIENNTLVIVEGKKDKAILNEFGINNIVTIDKPIYQIIESINVNEVIILTDLDKYGKRLYSILSKGLQNRKVKIDNSFRNILFRKRVSQIQGLKWI